jgi:hypothetical protein
MQSIGDAMVQIGQKELLTIAKETGKYLTGDGAALT